MIIVKLTLVPFIILGLSLAAKRWGGFVGGILSGLPIIAGPITLFLAIEQGAAFAIASANSTLLGILALSSFCFIYGLSALKFSWALSLIIGWISYFIIALITSTISLPPLLSLVAVLAFITLLLHIGPATTPEKSSLTITKVELAVRMCAAMGLVMVITYLAKSIGPALSGIFAAFPVAASVLAVFTHRNHSGAQAAHLLRGVTVGLVSLTSFYYGLTLFSNAVGFYGAFLLSLILVVVLQIFVYWFTFHRHHKKAMETH